MKANKYIFLTVALVLSLLTKTSLASSEVQGPRHPIIENENLLTTSSEYLSEKENFLTYIKSIKNSLAYISSANEIKSLYDNAIAFNSRALDADKLEWINFSYNNLKEDINLIEKIANGTYKNKDNINKDSKYFNNPLYKIPYLRLDKNQQDLLDTLGESSKDQNPITVSDLSNLDNLNFLVFFSDWIYPFMADEDKVGVISNSPDLIKVLENNSKLFENFRNASFEQRNTLGNDLLNKDKITDDISWTNLLTSSIDNNPNSNNSFLKLMDSITKKDLENRNPYQKLGALVQPINLINLDPNENNKNSTHIISGNIEKSNDFKDSNNKNKEDKKKNTIQSFDSIFQKKEKTREAYEKLTDKQKQILNQMNTDGKYPLTLDEVKKSGLFKIPVKNTIWIYPFMIDRNNSGEVGEYDGEFDNMEDGESSTSSPGYNPNPTNNTVVTNNVKLININEISTSPGPIENKEVQTSSEPVKSDEVSTSSKLIDNNEILTYTEPVNNNEVVTYTEPVANGVVETSKEIIENSVPKTITHKIIPNTNVKTGIKGTGYILIILLVAALAYYFSKKLSKK